MEQAGRGVEGSGCGERKGRGVGIKEFSSFLVTICIRVSLCKVWYPLFCIVILYYRG